MSSVFLGGDPGKQGTANVRTFTVDLTVTRLRVE
jgi:hypothetical protein